MPNLFACEVDADRHIEAYQQEIREKILAMSGIDKIPEEIESYSRASAAEPAMEESAIFDAVVDIVVQGGFDYYIYDLVPLGHALYYLSMASIYDAWLTKITGLREQMREYDEVIATMKRDQASEEDQIYQELVYIKDRIGTKAEDFVESATMNPAFEESAMFENMINIIFADQFDQASVLMRRWQQDL
ncbi:MAG: hypothetical protein BZ151_06735 [Desulfobacca sp. 4484_104]|nr:MAG: hypothetical protein BZ151_06735 [Desulfobacca sp. 4484_104]